MAKDPICGMTVEEKKAAGTSTHAGTTYYFCSANCKAEFDRNPTKHVR
jgi:YHS domain-containing protein